MSQQINLFNAAFHKTQTHFTLLAMLQSLGLLLAGGLLLYAYAAYQVSTLEAQLVRSTLRLNAEQASLAGYSAGYSPQHTNELLQNELQQLEKKAADEKQLADTLSTGAISNTAGYSEYFRAFARQVVPGLWLTSFKITAADISLSGGALKPELVPAYIQNLGHEAVMQGKRFSDLNMQPAIGSKHLEFTLHSTPADEGSP